VSCLWLPCYVHTVVPALHRTAEAKAAKAETERLAEAAAAEREQLADLEASNSRLQKHVEVRAVAVRRQYSTQAVALLEVVFLRIAHSSSSGSCSGFELGVTA
jgi:hypothetical protein